MFQFTLSVVIFVIISGSECTLLTANNNESIPNHNTIQTTDGKLTIILIGSTRLTISGKRSNREGSECRLLTANNNETIPNHNPIQTTDELTIILNGTARISVKRSNREETIVGGTGSAKSQEKKTPQFHTTLPLVKLGDSDNYYYFETSLELNYFEAFEFCRKNKMNLLSIESKKEDDLIQHYLLDKFPKVNSLWTSGTDIGREGHYIWLSTGQPFTFTNWYPTEQPDNWKNIEHCIHMIHYSSKPIFLWNDLECDFTYNFVCETESI